MGVGKYFWWYMIRLHYSKSCLDATGRGGTGTRGLFIHTIVTFIHIGGGGVSVGMGPTVNAGGSPRSPRGPQWLTGPSGRPRCGRAMPFEQAAYSCSRSVCGGLQLQVIDAGPACVEVQQRLNIWTAAVLLEQPAGT